MDQCRQQKCFSELVMGVDHVVVLAFALIFLLLFSALFVEQIAPMFKKAQFDELCRNYLLIAEANNGLTSKQKAELVKELESLGLDEIKIAVDDKDTIARRKELSLKVQGIYRLNVIVDFLRREERKIVFGFERHFLARRIVP